MPVLIIVVCIGVVQLLESVPIHKVTAVLSLIVFLSSSLDLFHLLKTSDISIPSLKSDGAIQDENYWAYQKLALEAQKLGPGIIFTDFILLDHDHSLDVTTFNFNALLNPKLEVKDARWAGIITNIHYVSFLSKRFSGSLWYRVTPYAVEDGGSVGRNCSHHLEKSRSFFKMGHRAPVLSSIKRSSRKQHEQ